MSFLEDLAIDVQTALEDLTQTMTYAVGAGSTFTAKLASAVSVGTNSINLGTLQTGLSSVGAGDVITVSPYSTKLIAGNSVAASSGVITGVSISPAMAGAASVGAPVSITKNYTFPIKGIVTGFDQTRAVNTAMITATTVRVLVDIRTMVYSGTMPMKPAVGDKITLSNGRVLIVTAITLDAASAFYSLLAN